MRPFARHYDAVYADKDYDSDIAVLTALCGSANSSSETLLEIGAGTGSHTVRLAPLFNKVTAIEIDREFAEVARLKTAGCLNVRFTTTPVEDIQESEFTGVAAFFNVLNYIPPTQMRPFLAATSARLRVGGWFLTDLWNGKAVLADPPRPETRLKQAGPAVISQSITPALDTHANTVTLDYGVTITDGGSKETFSESLKMHVWKLDELVDLLAEVGLSQVQFWDRRRFPAPATDDSWQVWLRAIKR